MPSPYAGNVDLPFAELIKLEQINDVTFRSIAQPFCPGGIVGIGRSYGGHVFAQAAWAAAQTVAAGFTLHNATGNFLLGGQPAVPYVYKVHNIRDGRSYCTRIVNVTQTHGSGICFTMTCSFKRAELNLLDVQTPIDILKHYSAVLAGKRPQDFELCPGMDLPFYWKRQAETGINDMFPGLEVRKVDMAAYNAPRHPLDRRQLLLYRAKGAMPKDDANLHICAHLYASDRNSLYIVANHYDLGATYTQMSTLVHSATFHSPIAELLFGPSDSGSQTPLDDREGDGRWFCNEVHTDRLADGRAMFHSRVSNPKGVHVATLMQEGMLRFTKGVKPTEEEVRVLREKQGRWKTREQQQRLPRDEKL